MLTQLTLVECLTIVLPHHAITLYHRLHGSASSALRSTGQVNGRWQMLTPTKSKPLCRLQKKRLHN